ncbi:hypothetical protein PF002_g5349 [Phytophthora fragariae]|uniref:Uncharacterized protein n=1 Tax=Phytophthora fragariae TaxID=53985 RepID=A0A6A4A759_9STRA|nr:hypothetical protein PF002_g5349 [Phytophthora fragariae]
MPYSESKWEEFWAYFRKPWLEMYPSHLWNIRGILRAVANRTKNPLERYNRKLNDSFPTGHPSIPTLVDVIVGHASRYVDLLEDIARKRARAPPTELTLFRPSSCRLRRAGEGPLLMEEAAHAGGGALLLTKDALHVVKAHALLVGMKGVLVVGRLLRVEDALSVL